MNLTAVVLTKNEEKNIVECLKTLQFASQILVIDNGSTDKTVKLAKKMKADIVINTRHDFSYLRNLAVKNAKFDWLLYVDSDERVSLSLAGEIAKAVVKPKNKAYFLKRVNFFYGKNIDKEEKMIRLIHKDALIAWRGKVHESAQVRGTAGILNSPLKHFTHEDFEKMVDKTNAWSEIEAKSRFESKHPPVTWWRFMRIMGTAFYASYFKDKGYRLGTYGLMEAVYQSFSVFITYAKLWQKQNE